MQEIRDQRPVGPPGPGPSTASPSVRLPEPGQDRLETMMATLQADMTNRLEEGLRAIHRSAARLMKQVAAEVWKATGPEATQNLQEGVISTLARDDAVRGILQHVEERHQRLRLDVQRLEEATRKLAEATGQTVTRIDQTRTMVDKVIRHGQDQSQRLQMALAEVARRVEHSVEPLTARLDTLEAANEAMLNRQRAVLAAFTERTGQGLAQVGKRIREGFAMMADRTAEENRNALRRIEASVQQEIERIDRQSKEQAARSLEAMTVVSRSVHEASEHTAAGVAALRDRIEARVEEAARETRAWLDESLRRYLQPVLETQRQVLEAAAHTQAQAFNAGHDLAERAASGAIAGSHADDEPTMIIDLDEPVSGLLAAIEGLADDVGDQGT